MNRGSTGLLGAIRIDLVRLHRTWMEVLFPRQLNPGPIVGRWSPSTTGGAVLFNAWAALGLLAVALGYPLLLFGFGVRFHARRLDSAGTRLGIAGVVVLSILVWGGLTVLAWLRNFDADGLVAVAAAGLVATVALAMAVVFARVGGRGTTVVLAYPSAMTGLFLPPVVAAFYSPALAGVVFPGSQQLAIWLLDTVLAVGGLGGFLRERFVLEGVAYVLMWTGIAVPLGWLLGVLVSLADAVRPTDDVGKRHRRRSSEMF